VGGKLSPGIKARHSRPVHARTVSAATAVVLRAVVYDRRSQTKAHSQTYSVAAKGGADAAIEAGCEGCATRGLCCLTG